MFSNYSCLANSLVPGQADERSSKAVEMCTLPYVLALHAFCMVNPALCAPSSDPSQFVVTLMPYLKNQVFSQLYLFSY